MQIWSIMDGPAWSLRRRNSVPASAIPTRLNLLTSPKSSSFPSTTATAAYSFPTVDLELISLKSESYTSLKDLLPSTTSAINSPTAASSSEISIRNRLVKQAAWAYLQPMSISPNSSGRHFFRRLRVKFSDEYFRNPVSSCLQFFNRHVIPTLTRVFDCLLRAIRVRTTQRR